MISKLKTMAAIAIGAGTLLAATGAQASLISSLPGSTALPFSAINAFTAGPETIAPGVTWTSTTDASVFGYLGSYGFVENGYWNGLDFIGLNAYGTNQAMTISFATPVSGVAAFLNYAPYIYGTPVISVYDASNTLIETDTLDFLTGGGVNTGAVEGFSEGSNVISSFVLSDAYIAAADLQVTTAVNSVVPEPASLALLGAGLAGLGLIRRRRLV